MHVSSLMATCVLIGNARDLCSVLHFSFPTNPLCARLNMFVGCVLDIHLRFVLACCLFSVSATVQPIDLE